MRWLIVGTGVACLLAGAAEAAPARWARFAADVLPVEQVRWQCNQNRCLDTRTGAYTASSCDWNGCRPNSGVVGYTNPAESPQRPRYEGYGYGRGGPGYGPDPRYGRGYGYPPPPPPPRFGYAPPPPPPPYYGGYQDD